jgi:hypothetical protein
MRKAKTPTQLEKDWSKAFKQLFETLGYEGYHPFLSIYSDRGYPDWSLFNVHQARHIWVELKTDAPSSKLSPAQARYRDLIFACGGEFYCLRPRDFDDAAKILQHKPEVNRWLD